MKYWLFPLVLIATSATMIRGVAATAPPSAARANAAGRTPSPARAPARTAARPETTVAFPAAGLRIMKPAGFTEAESFYGFQQTNMQSSVVLMRIPGPYSQVTGGFTADQLQTRGMELRSREERLIDGLPGLLLHVRQRANETPFLKWLVAFGDETQTYLVTATFPEARQAQLSGTLKAVALSARRAQMEAPAPGADLPFTLTPSSKLKITPVPGKMLAFTREGVLTTRTPEDPLFIAAPSLGAVTVADKRAFAQQRLQQTAATRVTTVSSHEPIRIADLDGYESVAEAVDAASGMPMVVYQVLLFEQDAYVLMQGLVGALQREEYLPEFKAMTRSFQRRPRRP